MFLFFCFFVFSSCLAILVNNPVLSVLCLVLVFILGAGFTFSLGLDYLGVLLLLIYVGAISVLFLFVVMLLNISQAELNQSLLSFWWLGSIIGFFFLALLCGIAVLMFYGDLLMFEEGPAEWVYFTIETSNIELVGEVLFTYMWDFFLLSSLLLLVAILGPVYISSMEESPYLNSRVDTWEQLVSQNVENLNN